MSYNPLDLPVVIKNWANWVFITPFGFMGGYAVHRIAEHFELTPTQIGLGMTIFMIVLALGPVVKLIVEGSKD